MMQSPAPDRTGESEMRVVDVTPPAHTAFIRDAGKPFGFFCLRDSMSYRSRLVTRAGDCIRR
jgi:hypothetical protein